MAKKHTARVHGKKKSKVPNNHTIAIIAAIAVLIIIGVVVALNWGGEQASEDPVLAYVNEQPIYQSELDEQWQALPVQAKLQLDREQLLEQLVQERLLMQQAQRENISVSDEEIQAFLDQQLQQAGRTEAEFQQLLRQQGTSVEEVKDIYRRQLTIAALFEQAVGEEPIATEEDIQTFYEENREQFHQPDQVTVRHLLIEGNGTKPALVSDLEERIDEENFCDLVENYSMDLASRSNCGEYTFVRGQMVPSFENASFEMDAGEIRTVESEFGYHIIWKVNETQARYLELDDTIETQPGRPTVRQVIQQQVIQQKARNVFDTYVAQLEEQAEVIYVVVPN